MRLAVGATLLTCLLEPMLAVMSTQARERAQAEVQRKEEEVVALEVRGQEVLCRIDFRQGTLIAGG